MHLWASTTLLVKVKGIPSTSAALVVVQCCQTTVNTKRVKQDQKKPEYKA